MKRSILTLLAIAILLQSKEVTPQIIYEHMNTFNKKLPMKLDKYMTLESATVINKDVNFKYKYSHNMGNKELALTQFEIDKTICNKESFGRKMIEKGYTFNSIYFDSKNRKVATIPTIKQDCIILSVQIKYKSFLDVLSKEEFKEFNPVIQPYSNIYNDRVKSN